MMKTKQRVFVLAAMVCGASAWAGWFGGAGQDPSAKLGMIFRNEEAQGCRPVTDCSTKYASVQELMISGMNKMLHGMEQ